MARLPKMARGKKFPWHAACTAVPIIIIIITIIIIIVFVVARTVSLYCEVYVYIHIFYCTEIVYELPLVPKCTASEFL